MAQILDLGKLRFNWAGTYSGSTEYSYNDIVKYGSNLFAYKSGTATTGQTPSETSIYWALVAEGTTWRGTYTQATLYYKNDLVTNGTSTFIVTVQHTSATPAGTLPNASTTLLALGQEGLPNQASNVNKLLTTDGTSSSWTATTRLTKTYTGGSQGTGASNFETSAGLTDAMSVFAISTTDFAQFPIVNLNNGENASTDFIAYTADGINDNGWIDMGITSNNFDAETYGITGPHDGYIFMSAPQGETYDVVSKKTLASVATLTTSLPHGYTNGDVVRVTGVGTAYDGKRTVTGAPTSVTFTFATTGAPQAETAVSPEGLTWAPVGDGNLVLATSETGLDNNIVFAAGGLTAGTTQMLIIPNETVHIEIDTESTSSTTGALVVAGGIGSAGNVNIAGDLDVNGTVDFSGVTTLPVGANANTFLASLTNPVIVVDANLNDYTQIAFQNRSSNANASTDFIAYSNNGTDSAGYIDMGITSSAFNDPEFTITGPGDGYIFMVGAEGGTDKGNLVFATGDTGTQNKIIFAAGGLSSNDEQMSITPGENVHIEIATESTSPTTGALTVVGGVGIQGDVNIQGNIVFGGEGTSVGTANLAVEAPFIFTGDGSSSQTNDLGLVTEGKYVLAGLIPSRKVVNKVITDNVATLTTSAAHLFLAGDSVVVTDVDATFNGTYTIASIPTATTFTYAKTASPVSSTRIGDQTFSINNKLLVSEVATLTTSTTHPYLVGEEVVVTSVDSTFNGTYTITAVTGTTFSYAKAGASNVTSTAVSPTGTSVVNQSISAAVVGNPVRTRYNAWSKDATDSTWKLASNIITEPETVIDYSQAGLVYDSIKVGNIDAAALTLSSTITGGASSNIAINTNQFTVNATSGNVGIAGTLSVTSTSTFTGAATFNGGVVVTGTTEINELRESVGNITLSSNVGTFDWTTSNVFYIATAPSAAMTFSFTNVPTTNNYMMTTNVFVTQGSTGYIPTTLNINGSAATIRWANGLTPTGTNGAGKIDIFTFSFHRTNAGAWIVYASANQNF
jgi:hypothetical protein